MYVFKKTINREAEVHWKDQYWTKVGIILAFLSGGDL